MLPAVFKRAMLALLERVAAPILCFNGAMAAIEAGDRQEMVPEGLGALLCSLALAADGPFEAAAGQPVSVPPVELGYLPLLPSAQTVTL